MSSFFYNAFVVRDKKKLTFLILTGSGGVRGHKKVHKEALSDISYEGPIRYLHQTLHIGVKITNMTNNVQHLSVLFLLNFGTNCQARPF